jgi:phage tail-like protein
MDRTPLFQRLPHVWQLLDQAGVLARFLSVWDEEFWVVQQNIDGVLATRTIEQIPDKFLILLTDTLGFRWNDNNSYQANRSAASNAITDYSYKGTDLAILDLARRCGASYCEIIDMASKCAVEGRQGTFGEDDNTFFDSDYFHGGVFVLKVSEDIDLENFLVDFEYLKRTGTKWYIHIVITTGVSVELNIVSSSESLHKLEAGTNFGIYMWTKDSDYYDYVPQLGVSPQQI